MGTSLEVNWGHQVDEQILTLEKSWKNRVEFPDDLPKIEKVAQEAIWEIIYTVKARNAKVLIIYYISSLLLSKFYFKNVKKAIIPSQIRTIIFTEPETWPGYLHGLSVRHSAKFAS